jgi:hypothetical protein
MDFYDGKPYMIRRSRGLKAGAHNVPLQSERTGCHIWQSCIRGFAECEVFISRGFSGIYR